eukprot:4037214-Pleurochrysis_carterae.AAC.2
MDKRTSLTHSNLTSQAKNPNIHLLLLSDALSNCGAHRRKAYNMAHAPAPCHVRTSARTRFNIINKGRIRVVHYVHSSSQWKRKRMQTSSGSKQVCRLALT